MKWKALEDIVKDITSDGEIHDQAHADGSDEQGHKDGTIDD